MSRAFARIEGLVAREANVAVVFRRGPSSLTQMLLWNLETDEVTPGHWIHARVNVRQSDVSPDGALLVAGLVDHGSQRASDLPVDQNRTSGWTAISRPPFFTALALSFDDFGAGGYWNSNGELSVFEECAVGPPDQGRFPSSIVRRSLGPTPQSHSRTIRSRLERDGWGRTDSMRHVRLDADWPSDPNALQELRAAGFDPATLPEELSDEYPQSIYRARERWRFEFAGGSLERMEFSDSREALTLRQKPDRIRLQFERRWNAWAWLDIDARGRIIFGDRGCLWVWEGFPDGEPRLIADLNPNRFEAIASPGWARAWPE